MNRYPDARTLAALSFAALTLLSPSLGLAEEADDGLDLAALLDMEVVTASKTSQRVSDAPATVWVVSGDQIRLRGYQSLEDLLDDIPEVEINRKSVSEYGNMITLRGIAGNEKFVILLDGVRISSPTGTPQAVSVNYPLDFAERVEVILGPASALYGADAMSGIINIITVKDDAANGVAAEGSFGIYNTTDNSLAVGVEPLEGLKLFLAGNFYRSDGAPLNEKYSKEFSWFNSRYARTGEVQASPFAPPEVVVDTGSPKAFSNPNRGEFVQARINAGNFEIGYARSSEQHSSSLALKPEYTLYIDDAKFGFTIQSFYARHTFEDESSDIEITSSVWHGTYRLDTQSAFYNTFTGYQAGYKFADSATTRVQEQISWSPSDEWNLIAGASFENANSLPKTGDLPKPYDVDTPGALQDLEYIGTRIKDKDGNDLTVFQDIYTLTYQNYGAYGQAIGEINSMLTTIIGARFDRNTRYGNTINPRAGVVVTAAESLKFKVLYGEAYLSPSPYKAYQHYGSFNPTTDDQGGVTGLSGPFWHLSNPDLNPEKLRTAEASANWYPTRNARFYMGGYYSVVTDLITNEVTLDQSFKGIAVNAAERPTNRGEATSFGGTALVDGRFGLGPLTFLPSLAYSYADGDIDGTPLFFTAMHTFKGGIDSRWGRGSISLRGQYRSASASTSMGPNGDPIEAKAYFVARAFARYGAVRSDALDLDVWLRVDNALDNRYTNASLTANEGFGASPQDPIRGSLGVSAKF